MKRIKTCAVCYLLALLLAYGLKTHYSRATSEELGWMLTPTAAAVEHLSGLEFERELGDTITLRRHPVEADNQWSRLWWLTPWGWGLAGGELVRIIAFYVGSSR